MISCTFKVAHNGKLRDLYTCSMLVRARKGLGPRTLTVGAGSKVIYKPGEIHEAAGVVMSWFRDTKDDLFGDKASSTAILRVASRKGRIASRNQTLRNQT